MDTLVFTRYLYSKTEVMQSLLIALLDRKLKEALFWTYELYYSGFQDDLYDYIVQIHDLFYYEFNPRIHLFIQPLLDEWNTDQTKDWIFASVIATLCGLDYDLTEFMKKYFGVKIQQSQPSKRPIFRIKYSKQDIEEFKTLDTTDPRTYLQNACKYGVYKYVNNLFKTEPTNIREPYWHHWQYYAFRSPYWKEIIEAYGGIANHEKIRIDFGDPDDEDDFNEDWGIDTDEQPLHIQEKSIGRDKGTEQEKQLTIMDFCNKYGVKLSTQKIKIKSVQQSITNSIMYM